MSEPNRRSTAREYLEALIVAALFLAFTNTFVLKTFYIPSGSMEDTLLVGDHLIVNRYLYGPERSGLLSSVLPSRDLRRGDIVIFRSPENPRLDLVKRCIGLPGDRVEILQKQLYLNGQRVDDHLYTQHRDPSVGVRRARGNPQLVQRDNLGPLVIPEGRYFFLGDNRDFSNDSRFWGTVPRELIKGRAFLIYWSYGGETPDGQWHGVMAKLSQLGRTALGFITRSRWSRTLMLVR